MAWHVQPDDDTIVATFVGHLTADEGLESAHEFAEALEEVEEVEHAAVVFDVADMTGYDSAARTTWQKALFPHRRKISAIELRGGNAIVRMGASVLALALGVPLRHS